MKIQKLQNNFLPIANILIFLTIFSIPLYFIRINILKFSISLLTLNMLFLSFVLLFINFKYLYKPFSQYKLFWMFTFIFIFSFIPVLFLYPSTHGLGVLLEWLILPTILCYLLLSHAHRAPLTLFYIQKGLLVLLFIVSAVSLIYAAYGHFTFDYRLSSFYSSPNHLAMLITPLIYIALAQFFAPNNSKKTSFFIILTLILSFLTLFLTNSWSSSIAFIFVGALVLLIKSKQKINFLLIGSLCIILILLISYIKFIHINNNLQRSSLFARVEIWTVATEQIQQHPILSNSPIDTFQELYLEQQQYYPPYLHWSAPTPHNLLFTLWISGGFMTILFFCLLSVRWLYISFIKYNKTKNTAFLLYIAAFLTILLTGILDTPIWKNDLALIFWLIIISNMFPSQR